MQGRKGDAMNAIIYAWKWFTWYQVVGMDHAGYAHQWWARDEKDALNWLASHKKRFSIVYGKRGKLLGGRVGSADIKYAR